MRGKAHELTKLARTRPYTARRRIVEVMHACKGSTTKMGRALGMSQRAAWDLLARLGLIEQARQLRAEAAAVARAAHQRGWSLYGHLYEKTDEGRAKDRARRQARKQRARSPTGGKR